MTIIDTKEPEVNFSSRRSFNSRIKSYDSIFIIRSDCALVAIQTICMYFTYLACGRFRAFINLFATNSSQRKVWEILPIKFRMSSCSAQSWVFIHIPKALKDRIYFRAFLRRSMEILWRTYSWIYYKFFIKQWLKMPFNLPFSKFLLFGSLALGFLRHKVPVKLVIFLFSFLLRYVSSISFY